MAAAATGDGEGGARLPPGVGDVVRDALLRVLENRPEDPLSFLSEYFGNLTAAAEEREDPLSRGTGEQQEQITRALKQLQLCHYDRPAFNNNLAVAYQILSCPVQKRKKSGLTGEAYTQLLKQICEDKTTPSSSLIQKLQCRAYEAVPFNVFRHGTLTCFIFLHFLKISEGLFEVVAESGKVNRTVCEAVIAALKEAVGISDYTKPMSYLEAGSKLGPDRLGKAMEQAVRLRKSEVASLVTKEEFIHRVASLFTEKVKKIF
uniref:Tubulin polyglutamylase complex subunit 1 n=1 Tax=Callorhinchus milii TaxID=7868 RepID=V9KZM2_CALMI|eukprot:gi/632962033/ref/XP_007897087.1/ PREDICTED: LOW QUALITY PROTEIN: tubulin polyglutamylase complex subunit 1 [Callorhinchus milii]